MKMESDSDNSLCESYIRSSHNDIEEHSNEAEGAVNHDRGHKIFAEDDCDSYSDKSQQQNCFENQCHITIIPYFFSDLLSCLSLGAVVLFLLRPLL